ncbi:hypothetical protein GCM10008101_05040 [Lysobacter xinjiangensis]|uniref:DUF4178 domain-containing protein n=1 Tax=Cognatilysobacter xinjiangensis TaxID=546892 RepID=A0ABQ3BU06_9GAMM|nr:TMEM43 family protein [Lysobacter xinjiangensis]GGZ54695.1 hypothetical protein GCM10008101_05040 [Lysobacter xinjiangensis]
MRRGLAAGTLLALMMVAGAVRADATVEGDPVASNTLEDADFGVVSSQFGLERRVEMYQWRRDDEGGYSTVWNAAPIDSSSFDAPHRNPSRLPVRNRQWWVESATLDGKPLPLAVIRLLGQWQAAKPNFSRLPGKFAERYQPEGDGLASSYNPLAPEIGDVRITWHEFVLPPLAGKVELHEGEWRLSAKAAAAPAVARPAVDIAAAARSPALRLRPWLIAIAIAALAALWFLIRAITGGKF